MSRARALIRGWGVVPVVLVVALLGARACFHTAPTDNLTEVRPGPDDPPGARVFEGSLANPRGGPVIVGDMSEGPARLSIAGLDLRGAGVIKQRVVLPAGAVALRFAAPDGARLVWSPVGRRGDPEYVPASSLSPEPPATARFERPGVALLDGVIALLLLAVVAGTVLFAARTRLRQVSRSTGLATAAVFAVAVIVRWIDLEGFGQTWDEDVNWAAGRNYVTNVLSFDFSKLAWSWNYEHPPVMKYLAGIGAQLADGFGPARALSAIWISVGCALLVPIGRRLFNLRTGVLAGAIAALLPPLVAHGQIVGHESPTVLWWSLGVLLALSVHDGLVVDDVPSATVVDSRDPSSRPSVATLRWRITVVGAIVGIAVASRFVNGLLGPLCVAIVVIHAPARWRRATLIATPLMVAGTLVAFYVMWPRLWLDPFGALSTSLAKLSNPHAPEPFLGAITNPPPASYFLVYLVATAPIAVLVAAGGGLVRAALDRNRASLVVVLWLLIPLAITASPVRQDGVRYVMPCLTALALLAASGLDALASRIRWRHAFPALATILVLYLGITVARTHPYYLDYFGEHVGGARGVSDRRMLETAWWGEGLDRAVAYVNANASPRARVYRDCIEPVHLAWFRADLWDAMVRSPADADWIVVYAPARRGCPIPAGMRLVHEVTHDGIALAAVYAR